MGIKKVIAWMSLLTCIAGGPTQLCGQVARDGARPAAQPIVHSARTLLQSLRFLGNRLDPKTAAPLREAFQIRNGEEAAIRIQEILDPLCLVKVSINPESRVKATPGAAPATLVQNDWNVFVLKVVNEAGVTAPLRVMSPNRLDPDDPRDRERWLDAVVLNEPPAPPALLGSAIEYRVIQIFSRDAGQRVARLTFDVGQGTQELGFKSDVDVLFHSRPSHPVRLGLKDHDGKPTIAAITVIDTHGRVFPSPARRMEPDFRFQYHVYRADDETLHLPDGDYRMTVKRGPEYHVGKHTFRVAGGPARVDLKLSRWIDPSTEGYWSGDHHIHAAGCRHYTDPSQGVGPTAMLRHCRGEDLKVGCALTWGPGFDYQKQFFTGRVDKASVSPYLIRYDIEVSGFGSHRSGHLCLLQLRDQMYPGGESKDHWPTLGLNTLRWAKKQGAVCGPAHSGFGLRVASEELPNYEVPPFDGIGANEYIVDVTHEVPGPGGEQVPAVDFISTVDTCALWELNIWYHTLNCGFRPRISGETDFPCLTGARVGEGRSYVKIDGELDYTEWCEGVRAGRSYVSEGLSHLWDFKVDDTELGTGKSELNLLQPRQVRVTARVAAWLDETPNETIPPSFTARPYWHLEKARVPGTRRVAVELVMNASPVARQEITADGSIQSVSFDVEVKRSSWLALRVLPSSHTNPIFVRVDGKPIRASRRSAEWCLKGVDQCWKSKERFYDEDEKEAAEAAYEHARRVYSQILTECAVD